MHIGHAKSICLNFGIAAEYGVFAIYVMMILIPVRSDLEYVESIEEDVKWLGFDWEDRKYYASDYFEKMYECAEELIKVVRLLFVI